MTDRSLFHRWLAISVAGVIMAGAAAGGAVAKPKAAAWQTNLDAGRKALTGGDYSDAERLLQAALDQTKFFKDGDPRMGITLRSMGDLNVRAGNYSLAKDYYERALAVDQKILGGEHLDVADELYGLALCNQQLGDHLAAEIFLKRVEEIWKKKLGAANPRLLSILPAMGAYASMKNNLAAAEGYYRSVVLIQEKEWGANNPKLGNSLNLLATVLGNEGKFAEAKEYANRAVELLKQSPDSNIALDSARDNLMIIQRKTHAEVKSTSDEQAVHTAESPRQQPQAKEREAQRPAVTQTANEDPAQKKRVPEEPKKVAADQPAKTEEPEKNLQIAAAGKPSAKQPANVEKSSATTHDRRPWQTDRAVKKPENGNQNWGKVRYLADGRLISAEEYKALLLATEAYEMVKHEKYRVAADLLAKAEEIYPAIPSVQTNLGLVLSRLGRSQEAIEHLRRSIALDSTRSAAWVNLASCFQATGQLPECVETYQEYLNRFPQDSLASKAQDLVRQLSKELEEQRAIAGSGKPSDQDYFAYTTYDGTVKWPVSKMPLKVHIASGVKVPGYKPEYEGLFEDSFKQWQEASGGKVSFDLAAKPENCDIECVWTDDYSKVSSPAEGGEAQMQWDKDGMEKVKVVILTKDPTPDSPLSQNQVRAVCLHEIGHSLGLVGHSPRPEDIMYCTMPSADTKVALSPRDVGTLKHLYANDVQIAVKQESPDYRSANNEGVALMERKAYSQAIQKFEEALKADPNYDAARDNLAKACNNYAIELNEKGQAKEAESFFKRAMDLQNRIKNLATRLTTLENYASFLRRLRRDSEATSIEQEAKKLKAGG